MFAFRNRAIVIGISHHGRVRRKFLSRLSIFGNLQAGGVQQVEQLLDVVDIWKRQSAMKKDRLHCLFGALLSVKAQVLKVAVRNVNL